QGQLGRPALVALRPDDLDVVGGGADALPRVDEVRVEGPVHGLGRAHAPFARVPGARVGAALRRVVEAPAEDLDVPARRKPARPGRQAGRLADVQPGLHGDLRGS